MSGKIDTRAIGLDAGLSFIRWLTGAENLHYGFWEGIEVNAGNLRAAQDAYMELLFSYLREGPLSVLDIGGGAGETAKKLLAMGHQVQIVVPSPLLADRCRANAPGAQVHLARFEDFPSDDRFDICLFSESFQYIALKKSLVLAEALMAEGGEILIADCFRRDEFAEHRSNVVGGGHMLGAFDRAVGRAGLQVLARRDITEDVAPSIDLEQGLFNVLGHSLQQIDSELADKRPLTRRGLVWLTGVVLGKGPRTRLLARLTEQRRNSERFCKFNRYQIIRLGRAD